MMEELRAEWLDVTGRILPSIAIERGFPVRFDHCFQRIALDNLFKSCWYDHLKKGRVPAYKQLSEGQLREAIAIAQGMVQSVELTRELNQRSLQWRGKSQ